MGRPKKELNAKRFEELKQKRKEKNQKYQAKVKAGKVPKKVAANIKKNWKMIKSAAEYEQEYTQLF